MRYLRICDLEISLYWSYKRTVNRRTDSVTSEKGELDMKKLSYGMVGGGPGSFIGDAHRRSINIDGQAQLVAGCFSRTVEKCRQTGEELGIAPERCYASYAEMAKAESGKLDYVVVVTPNVSHYEICKAFLEAGIHVSCDKPLCLTSLQADELVRLAEEKDLDMVISGVRMAVEGGADLKLLIVGGGPDLERLQNLVQQNGLTSYIQLTGPKPIDEVPAIYACADAFVSASLSETQGMTFIEALASGLPLFARPDDVLDDLLIPEKTGWFFDSAADLKEKLTRFSEMTKEQLDGMKDDCLARVRPYSNEVFYERMIAVYQRVCENSRYVPEGNGSPR